MNAPHRLAARRFLALVVLVILLVSAGLSPIVRAQEGPGSGPATGNGSRLLLPLIVKNAGFLPPIISPITNPLPPETTQELRSMSPDGVTYTFDTMTPALAAVAPGKIIVAEPAAAAPDGFLRRVTAINTTGRDVVMETAAATLEDAIQQGALHVGATMAPAYVRHAVVAEGVSLRPSESFALQDGFFIEITDVVLYDADGNPGTTGDQITADDSVDIAPSFDFDLVIRDWALQQLEFTTRVQETAELTVDAKIELLSVEAEIEIARYYLTPIVVFVGPMPVVFTPVLTVVIGADGSVHVGVTTGVTQMATLTAGLRYRDSSWSPDPAVHQ